MFYEEVFDKSMFDCSFVIIEKESFSKTDTISTLYHYFDVVGNDKLNNIEFSFDINKIQNNLYEFEIRRNDDNNTLIYSTEWANTSVDFINLTNIFKMSITDINEIAKDMSWTYITINRPFIHTKQKSVAIEDIYINYEVIIKNGVAYHAKINDIALIYFVHDWLPMVKNMKLGQIDDVNKFNVPENIRIATDKCKTDIISKFSFSVLWLYRYYTGDIFIINIEQKENINQQTKNINKNMFQYYVVAHLHICNNTFGKCHPDCVINWSESELDSLGNFLTLKSRKLEVEWYPESTAIKYKGTPIISQSEDCCFVDKTQINFNIY
jgi:hypothetical protein